jgi:S1-C subfamily serine protease
VISNVAPLGGAAAGGVRPGLVVLEINGHAIKTVADVERAAAEVKPGQVVSLRAIARGGDELIVNYRARR